jgi:gliotoxin/aspirochlorine biosynthesis thioredoxin reductase
MAQAISTEDSAVIIFTNGPPDESADIQRALKTATALGMKIESRRIERLKYLLEGLNVVLDDGDELYMGFLVHVPESVLVAANLMASLGLEITDTPLGQVVKRNEPFGTTNINGVFACGDTGTVLKHTTQAMAQGKESPAILST